MDIKLEKDLIKKSKIDSSAFGQLFDYYYAQIYRFIYKRTGNVEVAQDITSEVFFQALKSIWRYRITNRPFKSWLYRIAVVQIAQYYRHKEKYCELTLDNAPDLVAHESFSADNSTHDIHNSVEAKQAFHELHKALLKLSKIQHTIIILKYFENKKIHEISEILSIKINTVKSHLRRSVQKLEKILSNEASLTFKDYVKYKLSKYGKTFAKLS